MLVLLRATVTLAALLAAVVWSIAMVGIQSKYQLRYLADVSECRQVRELLPDPPPDAILLPLRIESQVLETRSPKFAGMSFSVWETRWTVAYLNHVFARRDIHTVAHPRWEPLRVGEVTEEGFRLRRNEALYPPYNHGPDGRQRLMPWAKTLPFTIDVNSKVHLVDRITLFTPNNNEIDVALPLATEAKKHRPDVSTTSFFLPGEMTGFSPLEGWRWEDDKSKVSYVPATSWGRTFHATSMHPASAAVPGRDSMRVSLRSSDTPTEVYLRASMYDWAVTQPNGGGDGVVLVISLDHLDEPLTRVILKPQTDSEQRCWNPITVRVPARNKRVWLRVTVLPGAGDSTDTSYDSVYVTHGYTHTQSPMSSR
jgi:hypothetical protein